MNSPLGLVEYHWLLKNEACFSIFVLHNPEISRLLLFYYKTIIRETFSHRSRLWKSFTKTFLFPPIFHATKEHVQTQLILFRFSVNCAKAILTLNWVFGTFFNLQKEAFRHWNVANTAFETSFDISTLEDTNSSFDLEWYLQNGNSIQTSKLVCSLVNFYRQV